jgi:hypothetical protein
MTLERRWKVPYAAWVEASVGIDSFEAGSS